MRPKISILYEDSHFLILNKPSGVPSASLNKDDPDSATGFAFAHDPDIALIGRRGLEGGLLHRLDTATSGILAFAKTEEAFRRVHTLWTTGSVVKKYRAVVGMTARAVSWPKTPFKIEIPMAHSKKSSRRMLVIDRPEMAGIKNQIRGKVLPALTEVLKSKPISEGRLDLEVVIHTGVMHQIRCHLAALGYPVEGDPLYGKKEFREQENPRLYLHAWRLDIPLHSSKTLKVEAPLPEDWPN